jgi:tetratricopeptide (TPR) repeat protein
MRLLFKLPLLGFLLGSTAIAATCRSVPEAPSVPDATRTPDAPDTIGDLIARGREALEAGRSAEAQKIFEDAAAQDGDSLRTRTWVIRSWMDQGRINDSLNAIDALDKAGAKGPAIDYLYGMAFALKARGYMASNVGGAAVQMSLDDAVQYLDRAVHADPELARDAFLPLAEAAWYGRKLDLARPAAERAVQREPKNPDAHFMLGRVALSQFSGAKDDPARKSDADGHWETARSAFARAAELLGRPEDPARVETLARIHVDLGHTYVWKQKLDEAQREYAEAMSWKPALVDMPQIHGVLGGERFLACLESASKALAARPAAGAPEIAALTWWLGWARYDQKQYEGADEAFTAAVAKVPAYVNSWFYIALSRYHRQDYEGAVAALRRYWDESPSDLVASIGANLDLNLRILDFLAGWCSREDRNAEAAELSEIQSSVSPEVSRYWSNAGLFWRDAAAPLSKSERPEDRKQALEWLEKSWKAYSKALEIEPDNPAYLNDAAVILHYYLDRDLERAKEMYKKAAERAEIELLRKDLPADLRALYRTTLKDSKNNLAKLERGEKRE